MNCLIVRLRNFGNQQNNKMLLGKQRIPLLRNTAVFYRTKFERRTDSDRNVIRPVLDKVNGIRSVCAA